VFWILADIYADSDPDPAFYLNADPEPVSQYADLDPDPDPGQNFPPQKFHFYIKNILYVANKS
jgi:hypothetical protein